MAGARIDTLQIADDPGRWRDLGFLVDEGGCCRLGATTLRLEGAGAQARTGIVCWTLSGSPGSGPVDGLPTIRLPETPMAAAPPPPPHPNSAFSLDHVVVGTPDFARTLAAIAGAGMKLRRTRETASGLRQAFFRHGEAILEVVGPQLEASEAAAEPASFWGLVANVGDIELAARIAGPRLGRVRDAVQPGRRIATYCAEADLSVRLALICG
ncbi:MAG: glyoxalase [Solirubrobacteraceae bacterium]